MPDGARFDLTVFVFTQFVIMFSKAFVTILVKSEFVEPANVSLNHDFLLRNICGGLTIDHHHEQM